MSQSKQKQLILTGHANAAHAVNTEDVAESEGYVSAAICAYTEALALDRTSDVDEQDIITVESTLRAWQEVRS